MNLRFIGGGAMATALIAGIVRGQQTAGNISVIDPNPCQHTALKARFPGIRTYASWDAAPALASEGCELVVLAVKPQNVAEALAPVAPHAKELPALLSIAAGVRVASLQKCLGGFSNIVRVMPNMNALIRAGITAAYADPGLTPVIRQNVTNTLSPVSAVIWFDDEAQLDVMTAVSGSGPAYVFYFLEALQKAAIALGLDPELARKIALRLTSASCEQAKQSAESFEALRVAVTSKKGTTEAAFNVLDAGKTREHFIEAIRAAERRAVELGDEMD